MTEDFIDLASEAVGGAALIANDEFFAEKSNLVKAESAVWKEGLYTDRGKWMDGWETRRRRDEGYDWCIVRLGIPGEVHGVVVDTAFFRGNYPESCALDGWGGGSDDLGSLLSAEWEELLPRTHLAGDSQNRFDLGGGRRVTHLRLRIYPDGGVARLRALGTALPGLFELVPPDGFPDLAGLALGGRVVDASDSFFSSPDHILRPGPALGMHDGWETRRRRGPGHDWVVIRLGLPGTPKRFLVDTTHFKGNAPGWASIDAGDGQVWTEVVPRRAVAPNRRDLVEAATAIEATHIRLNIYPDGGVARLRVFGEADRSSRVAIRLRYLNTLFESEARRFFSTACASGRWVETMLAGRPYPSAEAVLSGAGAAAAGLQAEDWREAITGHARIGEGGSPLSQWEQSAAMASLGDRGTELGEANRRYENRFGHRFLIYASGKTTGEVLAALSERLRNEPATELSIAAGEQRKITDLRLRRMLAMET